MTKRRKEREICHFLNSIRRSRFPTSVYFDSDFPIDELRSRVTSFPSLLSVQGNWKLVAQELDSKVWGGSQRVDRFRFDLALIVTGKEFFIFSFWERIRFSNFCRVALFTRCTPHSLKLLFYK